MADLKKQDDMNQSIDATTACRGCRASRPPEDCVGANGQPTSMCAKCRAETKAQYRRAWNLSQFGITAEQYDLMLAAQKGVCAVCAGTCSTGRRLTIDHDHETGRVRALLCTACNRQLGAYEVFQMRALEYLAKYGGGNPLLNGEGTHAPVPLSDRQKARRRKLTDEQIAEIQQRYATGSVAQHVLAAEYGVSQIVVSRAVRESVDKVQSARVKSFINRVRKLSDEDVNDARLRHENGESIKSIARSLGVAHTTISGLVRGKYWANN